MNGTAQLTGRQRANRAVLEGLAALWDAHPDWRFGQLVMNLSRDRDGAFQDTWEWSNAYWNRKVEAEFKRWSS